MPIKRCTLPNGKKGYKWGNKGKCYKSKKDALKQMRAIKVSQTNKGHITETQYELEKEN